MTATKASSEQKRPAPVVDLERIGRTYAELKDMEVKLDPNPIEYGPKRFNNRIARVRALLNRVDQIFLQISEDLHYFQRDINARRTLYELEKRELLVNDPRCRVGRSQQEREALADVQLRDQIEKIQNLEAQAHDLETLMISVKSKRTDLKNVQGRMKDQMKLIEHDIGMGARWGGDGGPSLLSDGVKEIDEMLASVDERMSWTDEGDEVAPTSGKDATADEPDEDDEEVEASDDQDPAPQASEEPVLEFGAPDGEAVPDIAELLPSTEEQTPLPDDGVERDADDFLTNFDPETEDGEESAEGGEAPTSDGIDDLIASFADD